MIYRIFCFQISFLLSAVLSIAPVFAQNSSLTVENGKIQYAEDQFGNRVIDFSHCGYKNSNEDIPLIENKIFVPMQIGDASEIIQRAIDYVENLPLNKSGFRGSVLLDKGIYNLDEPLRITKSGVVLRGSGNKETKLVKKGVDRGALLYVEGLNDLVLGDTISITSDYLAVNSRKLTVEDASQIKPGDKIMVFRPSTKKWIEQLRCDHFGGGITALGWKPGDMDILWNRKVGKVTGDTIEIDAPLSMALNAQNAESKVIRYNWDGRISNVGIENLKLESEFNAENDKDEDHCWTGISVDNASDCWIRQVDFKCFAGSAVILLPGTSEVTVEDCISTNPVSETGGMRRITFLTMGQLNLFQRCYSENGVHDFAAGYAAPGPNAFVQCESYESVGYSGAIDSWACGLLFDIVNIDGNNLVLKNLGQENNGAGWGSANSMLWQSTASEIECYSPGQENINRAYGCWAQFSGDGEWVQSNNHIQPRSLFYAQLSERLGKDMADRARILPMNTNATTSPTVEQALELAKEAYRPKLTLRKWIDDNNFYHEENNLGTLPVSQPPVGRLERKDVASHHFNMTNGKISFDNRLLTGGKIEVPWWSGKLRPKNVESSKPHITRFVPGREGLGLTDRIDSVVAYMKDNNLAVLDHNYGLWYDRRRDDHERTRRRDGYVWAPFYEQPFARSGIGFAWDGLSKYDLTKPNAWYWSRLKDFAAKATNEGLILFHENYFQHNIIEAGAHWVDSPWRSANNINSTGFPEPVPFAGDKRIFMADMFYDVENPVRRELHKKYIRQCLDAFSENGNVVQLISAEFTGPLHFVQFWIDEIAAWQKETGKDALVALSTTKDVQDAILADPQRAAIVDIIDIRYWHYKNDGEAYAPEGGVSMAPRQYARKMKVGKVTFPEAYKAVKEYRDQFPDKAVIYNAQNYPEMAWAVFMAGGSLPSIPRVSDDSFLEDALQMTATENVENSYYQLGKSGKGAIIHLQDNAGLVAIDLQPGTYRISTIHEKTGEITLLKSKLTVKSDFRLDTSKINGKIVWFKKVGRLIGKI